jgi:hypothetical protein
MSSTTKAFAHEQPKGYSTNVRPRMMTQFGTMISSEKVSAPSAGMGTSRRENRDKVRGGGGDVQVCPKPVADP